MEYELLKISRNTKMIPYIRRPWTGLYIKHTKLNCDLKEHFNFFFLFISFLREAQRAGTHCVFLILILFFYYNYF